jgi:hypothetical protein
MKRASLVLIVFFLIVSAGEAIASSSDLPQAEMVRNANRVQVPFIENKGHIANKEVIFFASTFGGMGTIYIEKNGTIIYNFPYAAKEEIVIKESFTEKDITLTPLEPPSPAVIEMFKKRMDIKEDISNYYRISWGEIYKAINLEVTVYMDTLEKLLTVLPGGNPENIKIAIKGVTGLKVEENGKLELITELGSGKFNEPFAYQVSGDEHKAVEVSYGIHKGTAYGFKVGKYDKNKPLMIRF